MKKIKYTILSILATVMVFNALISPPVYADADVDADVRDCNARFLTFPAWYRGLPTDPDCSIKMVTGDNPISKTIWVVGLNVVEVIIQLVGYVSVAYIIIGGWKYLLSNGSPEGNVKGRKTIINAVIGLIIALSSVAIVNTLANAV